MYENVRNERAQHCYKMEKGIEKKRKFIIRDMTLPNPALFIKILTLILKNMKMKLFPTVRKTHVFFSLSLNFAHRTIEAMVRNATSHSMKTIHVIDI